MWNGDATPDFAAIDIKPSDLIQPGASEALPAFTDGSGMPSSSSSQSSPLRTIRRLLLNRIRSFWIQFLGLFQITGALDVATLGAFQFSLQVLG
jgi:hypothetical protein